MTRQLRSQTIDTEKFCTSPAPPSDPGRHSGSGSADVPSRLSGGNRQQLESVCSNQPAGVRWSGLVPAHPSRRGRLPMRLRYVSSNPRWAPAARPTVRHHRRRHRYRHQSLIGGSINQKQNNTKRFKFLGRHRRKSNAYYADSLGQPRSLLKIWIPITHRAAS